MQNTIGHFLLCCLPLRLSPLCSRITLFVPSIISFVLYPCCFSLWMSLSFIWLNVVLLELVLRYCLVSPLMIARLTDLGWYDSLCMYSCLFVFLMCVFMSSMPCVLNLSPLYTVVSRNTSSFLSTPYVNLIVGWILFILSMYDPSCSLVPVPMMNISSIYLLFLI